MNIDEQLQELSRQTCPRQVDVVDSVMAQVRQHPFMITPHSTLTKKVVWRRVALTAVAAMTALVVLNISFRPSYDETQISDMMAYVSDYDYYSPVEDLAENPIEFLYEDYSE